MDMSTPLLTEVVPEIDAKIDVKTTSFYAGAVTFGARLASLENLLLPLGIQKLRGVQLQAASPPRLLTRRYTPPDFRYIGSRSPCASTPLFDLTTSLPTFGINTDKMAKKHAPSYADPSRRV